MMHLLRDSQLYCVVSYTTGKHVPSAGQNKSRQHIGKSMLKKELLSTSDRANGS
jgi:hypothetical protein